MRRIAEKHAKNPPPPVDALLSTRDAKAGGAVYTPDEVVCYILDTVGFPDSDFLSAKLIDLACGTGAFLRIATERLCVALKSRGFSAADGAQILDEAIAGIDIAPLAVAATAEALRSIATTHGFPVATFPQVVVGDSLAADGPVSIYSDCFRFIVGNPPYLEAKKSDPKLRAKCREGFPLSATGAFDIYNCFIELGTRLLSNGGHLGFIIPNKFLIADYAEKVRCFLLVHSTITHIVSVSDLKAFEGRAVYPIIVVLRKQAPADEHLIKTCNQVSSLSALQEGSLELSQTPQSLYRTRPKSLIFLPSPEPVTAALITRLLAVRSRVGQFLTTHWAISFHRSGLRDQFITDHPSGAQSKPLLGGKAYQGNGDVRRFRIQWSGWWIDYDRARAKRVRNAFPPLSLFGSPKLLIAQNAKRIEAAIDLSDDWVCKDTFLILRPNEGVSEQFLFFLLGILNSKLHSFYYQIVFNGTHIGGNYLHYLGSYIEDLPVERTETEVKSIADLARKATLAADTADFARIDNDIDRAVYRLFGLSQPEIDAVESVVDASRSNARGRRGQWWTNPERPPGCAEHPGANGTAATMEVHNHNIRHKIEHDHRGKSGASARSALTDWQTTVYQPYRNRLLKLTFDDDLTFVESAVDCFNEYYRRAVEFSVRHGIAVRSNFISSALDEFVFFLLRCLPDLEGRGLEFAKANIYAGLVSNSQAVPVVGKRQVSLCIGRRSRIALTSGTNAVEASVIVPLVIVSTHSSYADPTALHEEVAGAFQIISANPHCEYHVLAETKSFNGNLFPNLSIWVLKRQVQEPYTSQVFRDFVRSVVWVLRRACDPSELRIPGRWC